MILGLLILVLVLLPLLTLAAIFHRAPEGYQDGRGFHFGSDETPSKKRSCALSRSGEIQPAKRSRFGLTIRSGYLILTLRA
jgi:hypothetical protein